MMQTEPHSYVYRRAMRPGHITTIFGEADYDVDIGPFGLSSAVSLAP